MDNTLFLQELRDLSLEDARAYIQLHAKELADHGAVGVLLADEALRLLYSPFVSLKLAELLSQAGLPGIRVVQDPIEYGYTWHTNLDTYERVIEDDAKKSAIVIAATVYRLAMRDDPLPRFKREEMPPPPTPSP